MSEIQLMEVCGTHTMAIAKSGIKTILPEGVKLLSGPGCPVCVTPTVIIDAVLKLSERDHVMIATYGDMLKVPGSRKGDSLSKRKAQGARVEMIYSPMDALELAKKNPDMEIVFLGVGFETTAPGTAACIRAASENGLQNFSVFCMLKKIEPALRTLIESDGFNVQGFLCPGHVAVIIGEEGFRFLADEYHMPAVIAGFEPTEILLAIKKLLVQISRSEPKLENAYTKVVEPAGNLQAKQIIQEVFTDTPDFTAQVSYTDLWRGLGRIPASGYGIRSEYAAFDAVKKFDVHFIEEEQVSTCRCGDVICGRIAPEQCPLFGRSCTPADPEGPCMVSGEGACAAAYLYRNQI